MKSVPKGLSRAAPLAEPCILRKRNAARLSVTSPRKRVQNRKKLNPETLLVRRCTAGATHGGTSPADSHQRKQAVAREVDSKRFLPLASMLQRIGSIWQRATQRIQSDIQSIDSQAVNAQIKETAKRMRVMAVVLPFASTSGFQALILVTKAVASFINVYLLLLFVRVLLSWFPTFRWDKNPWLILRQVTDPYLNLFRGLIPPFLGTIDFTPLMGFFILQWLEGSLMISDEEIYW